MVAPRGIFHTCIVVGNIAFAFLAFCFAFVLGATKLPQMVVVPGFCVFTGVFLSYARANAVKHFRPIGAFLRRTPFWRTKSAVQTLNHRTPLLPRPPSADEAGAECSS